MALLSPWTHKAQPRQWHTRSTLANQSHHARHQMDDTLAKLVFGEMRFILYNCEPAAKSYETKWQVGCAWLFLMFRAVHRNAALKDTNTAVCHTFNPKHKQISKPQANFELYHDSRMLTVTQRS